MLGSLLKDGEDAFVNLPYAQIRQAVELTEASLDNVVEARLVVLGFGDAKNVLVNENNGEITGLIDFKRSIWGDKEWGNGEAKGSVRGLL